MHSQSGYYSLVQFCPDVARLEAVNVGVLLFCPASDFVEVKLADDNERVAKVFGKDSFNPRSLDAAKHGLVYRLKNSEDRPKTREDLELFVGARGDAVRLSVPRSLVTDDPQHELEDLFQKLVLKPAKQRERRQPLVPELDRVFRQLMRCGRARLNFKIELPVVGKSISVPYAYRNGVDNLVKPQRFSAVENTAENAALLLAVEGDLLAKHPAEDGTQRKLIVVAAFAHSDHGKDLRERVFDVLKEYQVQAIRPEQVGEFVEQVEREAH